MHSKSRFQNLIFGPSFSPTSAALAIMLTLLFLILLLLLMNLTALPAQAQSYLVLYTFTGGADGAGPYAGLTRDRAGNLYGTAQGGGAYGNGKVFKLTPKGKGWVFSPLYSFRGGTDGASPSARVIFGPDGSLYGTTSKGGLQQCISGNQTCGTVFKLQPPPTACKTALCPWTETVLYRFTGGSDGYWPANGALFFDQSGILYGTATFGGGSLCSGNGCGTVFSLTPSQGGWTFKVIYSFMGGNDGSNPYSGVISDNAGNLYGTAQIGGSYGLGVVYQLTPSGSGWQEKVLWSFTGTRQDLWAQYPAGGLIFDGSGNLYGTTQGDANPDIHGGTVFELTPSNGAWTMAHVLAGIGYGGPVDSLTMDAAGNLYGADPVVMKGTASGGIFEVPADLAGVTWLYVWSQGYAPAYGGPILDANGNLYGTNAGAGPNYDGVVWEITP
jgi:uncharacterized repeat protein (TIGR03803 family)